MTPTRLYEASHRDAVLVERPARGFLALTGADRRTYLQGLLTNDIAALAPGTGCYACYLTPQGRMIADMNVLAREDDVLLDLRADVAATVRGRLEDFVFTEDVQVRDLTGGFESFVLQGPASPSRLSLVVAAARPTGRPIDLPERELDHVTIECPAGGHALVAAWREYGPDGFLAIGPKGPIAALKAGLAAAVPTAGPELAEILRVEQGRPEFHVDMDEDTIPLEAGIEDRAISFDKGCYVGQEVIVRVLHRGHGRVARRLVGLMGTEGSGRSGFARGDRIVAGGREVGAVTSAVRSPGLDRPIALGYVHRDQAAAGTPVVVETGSGPTPAVVASFPIVTDGGGIEPSGQAR